MRQVLFCICNNWLSIKSMIPFLCFHLHYNAYTSKNQDCADALPWKFFAAPALHLHNIRAVIVYTCIIPYVTISMFKIGFSQKGWTFSPRVVPDFFRHGSFSFGQFLIWEVLQMTVIRPPWRNDYAIKSQIRNRTYWLRISGLWLCCRQYLIRLYASLMRNKDGDCIEKPRSDLSAGSRWNAA